MFGFETRADGTAVISGYVNAVGRDSRPVKVGMNKVIEQIMPGAFGEALRAAENVSMLLNHDYGQKLTDTLSGGLKLTEDSIGLRAEAVISDPDVIEKGRNGKLRGWSFGFRCIDDVMESRAEKLPRRIVKRLALNEVSVIDDRFIPCYEGTSVECRADGEADIEIRCFDSFATAEDMEEVTEERAEEPVTYDYSRFERAILDCEQKEYRSRIEGEVRFNPYHDPQNGRFISAGGSGGAYLYSKGGKSAYVFSGSEQVKAKKGQFDNDMYEVAKTVNGQNIYRMKGTHGYYHVEDTEKPNAYHDFHTQKAAAEYIESHSAKPAVNEKHNGFSVTDDTGKTSHYVVKNGSVFEVNGSENEVFTAAYKKNGSVNGVIDKINSVGIGKASVLSDSDVDKMRSNYNKTRKEVQRELDVSISGNKHSVNRHRAFWSAM